MYDEERTTKHLQESSGIGRYMLNVPGWGDKPMFINDPQIRMQLWGGNNRHVDNSSAIDIHSDLLGIWGTKKISPYCRNYKNQTINSTQISYPTYTKTVTHESRTTHPTWMYKDLQQDHTSILLVDPQKHIYNPLLNNINTRNIARDNYITRITN
jgi:hypothetical protein